MDRTTVDDALFDESETELVALCKSGWLTLPKPIEVCEASDATEEELPVPVVLF